ncbi:MAG: hypothetical protein KGN39_00310 [Betaproteobacteria bacterium]|nr:hypothetical protein [Betaproteobacteria bacterium]
MAWRALSLGIGLLALSIGSAQAGKLFCCEVNGQKTCGDILPAQCAVRGYTEINKQGVAVRQVAPPLTPEQQAQKEAEEQRKKEAEAALKEQKRKDMALLNTYSSEKDIDLRRAQAEQDVDAQIKQHENKLADAQKRLKKLKDEAEFYKKGNLPPDLNKHLRDTEYDIKSLGELIEARQKDLVAVRARFDADKQRYIELTRGAGSGGNLHPALVRPTPPAPPADSRQR